MAITNTRKKKRKPRKFGVEGPRADFNAGLILDTVKARAASHKQGRYTYLKAMLSDAGFTDAPAPITWRQWEKRRKIAGSWLPTVLYATLIAGEKITVKDLLQVEE